MNYELLQRKVDHNKYILASLVGKRAREIVSGSEPLVDCKRSNPITTAMEEVAQGKISFQRAKNNNIK